MGYTEDFKKMVVSKLHQSPKQSCRSIAEEFGIGKSTIYKWSNDCANVILEDGAAESKRPVDWTRAEKLEALLDSAKLSDQELGSFCRKRGIHSHQLTMWKTEIMSNESSKISKNKKDELKALRLKNKELERDLRRKDKALAEATALLILKKKADLIWGVSEDD